MRFEYLHLAPVATTLATKIRSTVLPRAGALAGDHGRHYP
jgi:hypothetical protein